MSSHYLATTRKVAFFFLPSLILGWSRCRKLFERAIWALDTSSFRPQSIRILRCSSSRKSLQSDMGALETSLFRNHPSRILGWSIGRKWVPSAWRPHETSPSRHHQSRILGCDEAENDLCSTRRLESSLCRLEKSRIFGWSRSRKWLQSPIRQLESSQFRLYPNRIFGWSSGRKWVHSSQIPEKWLYWLHPSRILGWSRGPKIGWKGHAGVWNNAFSTSTKSYFGMVKMPKMSSKWQMSNWNIVFSTSPKSHFGLVKRKKNEFQEPGEHLKNRFQDLTKVELWACQEAEWLLSAIPPLKSSLYRH